MIISIIREPVKEDVEQILWLLKEFQKEGPDEYGLQCDDNVARGTIIRQMPDSLVLEANGFIVGMIGGMVTHYPLNNDKVFQESIWYVKKDHRGRMYGDKLLKALEERCKARNIKKIVMAHTGNVMPAEIKRFYEKKGYKYLESHYIKRVR